MQQWFPNLHSFVLKYPKLVSQPLPSLEPNLPQPQVVEALIQRLALQWFELLQFQPLLLARLKLILEPQAAIEVLK